VVWFSTEIWYGFQPVYTEKVAMIFSVSPYYLKYHAKYHMNEKWFAELKKYPEPTIEEYVEMFRKKYED